YPLILQADRFIAEMDLDMLSSEFSLPKYDIHQFLKEKAYIKLRNQLMKSFRLNIDQFGHLHPLMIMSIISTSILQAEHHISLDEHLWNYSKLHDKPASGLETYDQQFEILHSIDPGPIYKQLMDMSKNTAAIKKNTAKSLDLYVNGRIHELYMLSKASMQNLRKKVIYERNKHMVSVIDHLDNSLQYFITAGAGHLSGKFGLLSLLKKAGWNVKPARLISKI
ncbi:MAG TPA: TraB/GumN family protein, partial [Saprospiraceae bacterium]|nr:TraB/GumN family protein [Saprospiraceae bacterium]